MKAVRVAGTSGMADMAVADIEPPGPPGRGEVLIEVAAAALNFADLLMLTGAYQDTPAAPFTAGMECAGTVLEVGPDVDGVFTGDRVAAAPGQGAFAERALAPAANCMRLPPSMDMATGAGFQIAYGTAHVGLAHRARLRHGELLLVTGAGGGVGLAAVEVGRALGARVVAAAGSPEKLALAEARGADYLVDYRAEDLRERVKAIAAETGRTGADVVFDPVGGEVFAAAMRATGFEGRLIVVGFAGGEIQQIPANRLLVKNIGVLGLAWGAYGARDPAVLRHSFTSLAEMYEAGQLHPHIGARRPLDAAAEAYRLVETRAAEGKVVLEIGESGGGG